MHTHVSVYARERESVCVCVRVCVCSRAGVSSEWPVAYYSCHFLSSIQIDNEVSVAACETHGCLEQGLTTHGCLAS